MGKSLKRLERALARSKRKSVDNLTFMLLDDYKKEFMDEIYASELLRTLVEGNSYGVISCNLNQPK